MGVMTTQLLLDSDLTWLVEHASRAPSIHNTQPWQFTWDGAAFNLYADTTRGLTVSDPTGRELAISCGAALFNLRLALRRRGFAGSVSLLPDSGDSRLMARVTVRRTEPATFDERQRFRAMVLRHTHRGGFEDRPIPAELQVLLHRAVESEDAQLVYVNGPGQRHKVLQLAHEAAAELDANEHARIEVEEWTPARDSRRRDGVPATAYPARPALYADELAARDFDLGRGVGTALESGFSAGLIGVLVTPDDDERAWLVAGQALEHALIDAAQHWVFAAIHSQLCEVPPLRGELRRELGTAGHPQILLRFGYAHAAPATPRRPASEVLTVVDAAE